MSERMRTPRGGPGHDSTLALAALEVLAHMARPEVAYVSFEVDVPDEVKAYEPRLPKLWANEPHGRSTQHIGDRWVASGNECLMKVPSTVVRRHFNFVLDPVHRDFERLKISPPEPFVFDRRILPGLDTQLLRQRRPRIPGHPNIIPRLSHRTDESLSLGRS